jgi:hypothetical protein
MSDLKYVSIKCKAQNIASDASAAFWDDRRADFHEGEIRRSLAAAADLLGLMLVPKPDTLTALPEQPGEWIDEVIK